MTTKLLQPVCYIATDRGIYAADSADSRKRCLAFMGKYNPVIYDSTEYDKASADYNTRLAGKECKQ